MTNLTQEQTDELYEFVSGLNEQDDWLFFHCAWARGDGKRVTNEDKYEIMLKWDTVKEHYFD